MTAALGGFQGAIESVPLPQGVELRSDEEHVIWDQFTRARAREDWRDMDLLLLAKVVRMEADIRKHQDTLDRSRRAYPKQTRHADREPIAGGDRYTATATDGGDQINVIEPASQRPANNQRRCEGFK